ncbi:hypothetical protein M5689_006622 [Euphorbia peplus]|nr:hypothetical protein M5689_006622 [Euphorbia peplus]
MDTKDLANPTLQVKTGAFIHECNKVHTSKLLTSQWIGMKYLEKFRLDPDKKVIVLKYEVKHDLELTISKMKAYREKVFALQILNGDALSQYNNIYMYDF